jgi:hypothetical protein
MIRPTFSWNVYFCGTSIETTLSGERKTRQNPSVSSVYVLNCLFKEFTSGSNGGALYCTSVTSLLIESSSFFSCKTSSNRGGAIYFSNSNSQCVLYGVCGYDCCSTYAGGSSYQFAFIYVNDGPLSKNYVNYSSISRCVNERKDSGHILELGKGKNCCPSINISMNKCQRKSGITCYPFTDSNSFTFSCSYSTFVNNNAPGDICLYFNKGGSKYEMKCCNILRNSQGTTSNGIIYATGNTMIKDSCILENTATCIFYVTSPSYSITLSNCTVDKTTNNRNLIIQNIVNKSFIHGLNHLSTQNCNAEYDSIGTLSAIPFVSSPTKKLFYYSCKRNDILSRISDFFSLDWLFK